MNRHKAYNQDGASLLEILVTLVVVALGLLGIAGMKLTGLKDANLAYQYSVAVTQTQDMAERIGANWAGRSEYNAIAWYDPLDPDEPDHCISTCNNDGTSCTNPACDSEGMANDDVWFWQLALRSLLPDGNGRITTNNGDYLIAVRWADPQMGANDLGWDSSTTSDAYLGCGDPAVTGDKGLRRCHVLRYRP